MIHLILLAFIVSSKAAWIDAKWTDIPYMVSLQRPTGHHFCGGSILSKNQGGKGVILTAAHCTGVAGFKVAIGCTHTACTNDGATIYTVETVTNHPSYTVEAGNEWLNNDVAVVKLTAPITHPGSRSVILESDRNHIQDGEEIMVTGYYGKCNPGNCEGGSDIDTLEYVISHFMDQAECTAVWGDIARGEHDFCLKDEDAINGVDTLCSGDSGSPLVYKGRQIGVISWAHTYCNAQFPQAGTYLPFYYDWIISVCGAGCGRELMWGAQVSVGNWQLFEGAGKWYKCPVGFVVGGFWKNWCQNLYCLEEMKCVKPDLGQAISTVSQSCYELNIWSAFDHAGTVECAAGYFVRGIWSNNNDNWACGLYCWELIECCKYDESIIGYDDSTHDENWWSCFDGSATHWCLTSNNEFITGFYKTEGNDLFNLELAKVRGLYLQKECRNTQYDSAWLGLGSFAAVRNKEVARITVGNSMVYKMDIKINSFPTDWASVFHCGVTDGMRIPGIWLHPDSDNRGNTFQGFHMVYSTDASANPWVNPGPSLTAGQTYSLEIRVTQSSLIILVNGNVEYEADYYHTHATRTNVPCYVSDPWFVAADVELSNIEIAENEDDGTCGETQNIIPLYRYPDYNEPPAEPDFPINYPKDVKILSPNEYYNKGGKGYFEWSLSTSQMVVIAALIVVVLLVNICMMMKRCKRTRKYQVVKQLDSDSDV